MVFMVILQCYGLHIDIGALVVLILFGVGGGRYWRVLGPSGGFVLTRVVLLLHRIRVLRVFRVWQVLLLDGVSSGVYFTWSSCRARPTACALPHVDSVMQNRACGSARCVVLMKS